MAEQWVESLVLLGRWSEAERLVGELADLLDHPTQEGELAGIWGVALIRQGRLDEARPLIEHARALLARGNWFESQAWLVAAVVMFDAAQGATPRPKRTSTGSSIGIRPASIGNSYLVATAIAAMAEQRADRTGRNATTTRASSSIDAVTRWIEWMDALEHDGRQPITGSGCTGTPRFAAAPTSARRSDPQLWAQLAAGWDQIGFRYDKAYAQLRHAEALLAGAAGRSAAARRAATRRAQAAHNVAHELNAIPLLTEIEDLIRRARLPLDTNGSSGRRPRQRPSDDRTRSHTTRARSARPAHLAVDPTDRSPTSCSSPRRPPASTSPTSSASWASPTGSKPPPSLHDMTRARRTARTSQDLKTRPLEGGARRTEADTDASRPGHDPRSDDQPTNWAESSSPKLRARRAGCSKPLTAAVKLSRVNEVEELPALALGQPDEFAPAVRPHGWR